MITLEHEELVFRFPEVHKAAICRIGFQRTLRIPDDDKTYPLPPGLGYFPLRHLDDFTQKLSKNWLSRGGVITPMYQAEAMWIAFTGSRWRESYPFAVKVATGKINAITGEPWTNNLNRDPQDYVVIPDQPWLDGYCVEKGIIRQFVAMPLGEGYSVEEQLTEQGEYGGVQIVAYPMKADRYEELHREIRLTGLCESEPIISPLLMDQDMGLAPGGRMKQEIYDDRYGLDAWDQRHGSRCFVTITNSTGWMGITGERPPSSPPTAMDYANAGLPWFDYYHKDAKALEGGKPLAQTKSVMEIKKAKGEPSLLNNETVNIGTVVPIGSATRGNVVREVEL